MIYTTETGKGGRSAGRLVCLSLRTAIISGKDLLLSNGTRQRVPKRRSSFDRPTGTFIGPGMSKSIKDRIEDLEAFHGIENLEFIIYN